MTDIKILNDVEVTLKDYMGNDRSIANAARVSTLGEDAQKAGTEKDEGLINYLMKNRHGTPFEHNAMTFFVKAPIFVFREFHRHRVGFSYNEMSGRYTELLPEFYIPKLDRPLVQSGKPGHYVFNEGTARQYNIVARNLEDAYEAAWRGYQNMLESGIAKEVARMCLPVGIFSQMYVTCNARSLMSFLSLRTKGEDAKFPSFPQHEIELVAKDMEVDFATLFPMTWRAFQTNGRVAP